ncbi:MAG: hypothetical protein FRX49_11960 [Trebouxia sp. A1-2]|nr:MAG: hypothetical protein FRX49_11960 [Trebouxia sp. A1-2]
MGYSSTQLQLQQDKAKERHVVLKEVEQLWRLFHKTWQRNHGCLLLLLSLCISATVMWAMSKSFLPERVDVPTSRQLSRHQLREMDSAPSAAHDSGHAAHGRQSKVVAQYTTQLHADPKRTKTVDSIPASRLSGFQSAHVLPGVKTEQMNVGGALLRHTMSAVLDTSLQVKGSHRASKAYLQSGAASAAAYAASSAAAAQQAVHDRDEASADVSKQLGNEQLRGMISPSSRALQVPGKFGVTRQDLVVAVPSDPTRAALIQASKAWRQAQIHLLAHSIFIPTILHSLTSLLIHADLKTFVAVNTSSNIPKEQVKFGQEVSISWFDNKAGTQTPGCESWEARVALTPFLAHQEYQGEYEWMLYGHDDTFFFVDGALDLLQDFDPSLPYIITDHFWWSDEPSHNTDLYHPHERAPHCLPCHWTPADEHQSLRAADSYLPFAPYTGCPCTVEQMCRHDSRPLYHASCDTQLHPLPVSSDIAAMTSPATCPLADWPVHPPPPRTSQHLRAAHPPPLGFPGRILTPVPQYSPASTVSDLATSPACGFVPPSSPQPGPTAAPAWPCLPHLSLRLPQPQPQPHPRPKGPATPFVITGRTTMHIGAGALISRGLLAKVSLTFMQDCIQDMPYAQGANSLFSHCIQKAGFAFTSPGYSFYHWEAKAFDPGPEGSLLLLQALQDARMGSADDISLVCIAFPLCNYA